MKKDIVKLFRRGDQVIASCDGIDEMPVTIVWLRPASGIGKEISLLGEHTEFMVLDGLHVLDEHSRRIAEEELERNYLIPKISKIVRTDVHLGNRYFEAETNKGRIQFVVKNPFVNIRATGEDGALIRDVVGNQFCIVSMAKLDEKSQREFEKVV